MQKLTDMFSSLLQAIRNRWHAHDRLVSQMNKPEPKRPRISRDPRCRNCGAIGQCLCSKRERTIGIEPWRN